MIELKKLALKLLRKTNGEITYTSLKNYITNCGYVLIPMNTEEGDTLLKNLGVYDKCKGRNGKMIATDTFGIVAISNNLSVEDKINVMLHEICHILKHGEKEAFDDTSSVQRDNEAEAFAYEVLRLQKYKILYNKYIQVITACVIAGILALGIYLNYSPDTMPTMAITQVQPTITAIPQSTSETSNPTAPAEPQTSASTKYYVMPSGKVYHEEGCQHINKNAFEITIEEASKRGLPPCKTCKPDKE